MTGVELAGIIAAFIAAGFAYLSSRAANQASIINAKTNAEAAKEQTRTDLETEAYIRARQYDLATIARKDAEIQELRAEREEFKREIAKLKQRVAVLETEHQHCEIKEVGSDHEE